MRARADLLLAVSAMASAAAAVAAVPLAFVCPDPFGEELVLTALYGAPAVGTVLGVASSALAVRSWARERATGARPSIATLLAVGLGLASAVGAIGWLALTQGVLLWAPFTIE